MRFGGQPEIRIQIQQEPDRKLKSEYSRNQICGLAVKVERLRVSGLGFRMSGSIRFSVCRKTALRHHRTRSPDSVMRDSVLWFHVPGSEFRASGFWHLTSPLFWDSGSSCPISAVSRFCCIQISSFCPVSSVFGFRVSVFGFHVSVSDFGFLHSDFGSLYSEFRFRGSTGSQRGGEQAPRNRRTRSP